MDPLTILALANGLVAVVGNITAEVLQLKALAAANGATDAQLQALDDALSLAIAARKAEQ